MKQINVSKAALLLLSVSCVILSAALAAQDYSPDAIRQAEHESLRKSICPGPGAPAPDIKKMFDTELQHMAPARIFDDFYMLGMKTVTAWALVTSEGIILIDAMLHSNVEETVVGSMRELGLDPADIKYVIVSHAHNDHFGGARYLQDNFHARIVMSEADWKHMHTWPQLGSPAPLPEQDVVVHDGETITLGGTIIKLLVTPGHTPGTLSPVFPVHDGDEVHYVGYWGGSGVGFLAPEQIAEYIESAERFAAADGRIDVPLSNHPSVDASLLKRAALKLREPGDPHPFVEGNPGFREWMTAIRDCAGEVLERKRQAALAQSNR